MPGIVTFVRNGQELELGQTRGGPSVFIHGSTGLGVAPVEIAKSPRLAGDGSVVRGVRYSDRTVFIPLFAEAESMGALHAWRRELTRLLAPVSGAPEASLVEVRVEEPESGNVRTIRGIYQDGLSGDFGEGYHGKWQTLGLVLECSDPWWLGQERIRTLEPADGVKPFLSDTIEFFPIILAESAVHDEWDIRVEGDAPVWPVWEINGPGEDLLIESVTTGERIFIDGDFLAGTITRIDTGAGRIVPDRWDDVSLDSRLFPLQPGLNTIRVSMVGATGATIIRLVWQERWVEGV